MSLSHFSRRAETLSFHHLNGNVNHSKVRNALTYSQRGLSAQFEGIHLNNLKEEKKSLNPNVLPNPSEVMKQLADWKPKSGGGLEVRTGHQLVLFVCRG